MLEISTGIRLKKTKKRNMESNIGKVIFEEDRQKRKEYMKKYLKEYRKKKSKNMLNKIK